LKQLNVVNPHRVLLEDIETGGVLGLCVGFLSAIAVATSEIETGVAFTAARSISSGCHYWCLCRQ
jgi:hypothetical protein